MAAELRPYYNRFANRRGDAGGGPTAAPGVAAIVPGLVDGRTREIGDASDTLITRDRTPVYDNDTYRQAGELTNWTLSGPIRRSLWMRNHTLRRMVGSDNTRNLDPRPVTTYGTQQVGHGMHSNPVSGRVLTGRTFASDGRAQMSRPRANRLADSVYTGQSYSQTTVVQGGGAR